MVPDDVGVVLFVCVFFVLFFGGWGCLFVCLFCVVFFGVDFIYCRVSVLCTVYVCGERERKRQINLPNKLTHIFFLRVYLHWHWQFISKPDIDKGLYF